MTTDQVEARIKAVGGKNVSGARLVGQIFCELNDDQVSALSKVPGLIVKGIKTFNAQQVATLPSVDTVSDVFYLLRSYFSPPLTGTGLTVAVLDSGIRKTHESLLNKVIYEYDCTGSPSGTADVFGHGTQVAFVIAGGLHAEGTKAGVSPGARLFNIKVIDDSGSGDDESVIMGIDKVCQMAQDARTSGLLPTDDLYPNVINISFGGDDDGDTDNPVRAACRSAVETYGLDVVAAAGNSGPTMTTIELPACEPDVIAVGGIQTLGELVIWDSSSRGPTKQGETKPDFVMWATNIEMASEQSDTGYVTKSGTSFSAPMLSGLTGLLWESGRRAYGEGWPFNWTAAKEVAQYFCTKPVGAAINKDNTYGFGLPAMGTMLSQMTSMATPTAASTMTDTMNAMMPALGMFMMMAMVIPMMKGIGGS